ncbi:MAG TPA: FecR domain-containing protein [Prolixibacteraceae bacterium]|nr:FecR domain-containing protein [Prolixibacteraceae bacterium]
MERLDIDQLVRNDFSGIITPEEQQLLDQWIGESSENDRYYTEQKNLLNLFFLRQKMQQVDEHKAYTKISSKLFPKNRFDFLIQLQRIAAILLLPVLIVSALYYYSDKNHIEQFPSVYNTVETPLGMRSGLTLPDGTKVWLNAGTKLSYPVLFSDQYREVKLSGEAYFEVKKNKKWPFIVNAGNMNLIVTGTTFNCNAYPENNQIQTVLVEGQVTVMNVSATWNKVLEPGELAVFSRDTQQITKIKTDLEKYIAWKSGKLMFREDKMNLVVEKLQRWYNVDFEIMDKEISDYVYTATFIDESLDQVLKMLSLSAPINYSVSLRTKLEDQTFARQIVKLYKKKI